VKVLLCTITVGEGVNKICRAVAQELENMGIENEVFNVYQDCPERAKFVSESYYKIVKRIPRLARFFQRRLGRYDRNLLKAKNYKYIKKDVEALRPILDKKVNEEGFDVIYSPVASVALTALLLRREGKINCKIVYNIPDFNIPTYAELCNDIDAIISPCKEATENLLKSGFDEKQVFEYKIPIDAKFLVQKDKKAIKDSLNIPQDKFTVLIMSGGFGFGSNGKILNDFLKYNKNVHFIVVNGRNEEEKNKIDKYIQDKNLTNVTNIGFCTVVDEMMTAADVVFTKLGAATMCESFAKEVLIITTKQKLYPEFDNMLHLEKRNAILVYNNTNQCAKAIAKLTCGEINYDKLQDNFKKEFNKNSAKDIAGLIKNI